MGRNGSDGGLVRRDGLQSWQEHRAVGDRRRVDGLGRYDNHFRSWAGHFYTLLHPGDCTFPPQGGGASHPRCGVRGLVIHGGPAPSPARISETSERSAPGTGRADNAVGGES